MGKNETKFAKIQFPKIIFSVIQRKSLLQYLKIRGVFRDIVFPYLEKVKEEKCIPKEQYSLAIMDTFKGQDNRIIKELYHENFCEVFIVLQNLTNKFQLLDTSVNKSSKAFISKVQQLVPKTVICPARSLNRVFESQAIC